MSFSRADLGNALAQCAAYADGLPWSSPDQLFALVPTAVLAEQAPELVDENDDSALSPVLQEAGRPGASTEELLATIGWPEPVAGCALVTEITVVPPGGDESQGRRARLIGGVLRTGSRVALLALEPDADDPDDPNHLRTHDDLAPELLDALAATFEEVTDAT
ncbi:PPA1309 family protein [Gordonia sp. (in: high G+C Gram-positive bacteria)]|uniref:PPA1309 family protein n=2 Tax=Gordonia TaxID=2053 RepID=UPI00263A13CB|nr:PPA1309 family protein [Gordonia sp. (in: high G+C Gram-positive bacteria)]